MQIDLELIFTISLGLGIAYVFLTLVFGQFFDFFLDFDFDFDLGTISPKKPAVLACFLTVFGGVGLILLEFYFLKTLAVFISIISAIFVSFLMQRFIIKPLSDAQNTSSPSKEEILGTKAFVSIKIPKDAYGRISYVINGNSFTSPAKSDNGEEILNNKEVLIIDIDEKNAYIVSHIN